MLNFSNYTIIDKIGVGGMSIVYSAKDKKFDALVAIKVLNKEFEVNQNFRKRFLAEARNLFKMSHSNIVKVTDLIEESDTVAFVMEYIEGETLRDYIERKGRLNDDEIENLFKQMLDAVGYVHAQSLVHRDIKPSNFMVDKNGRIKLMDFGIAKEMDPESAEYTLTGTSVQMGTPMYMSPEQVKSSKDVTFKSDIYSLGVVLWQMVSGKKPYNQNDLSIPEIQVKIIKEPLPRLKSKWYFTIKNATAKDPDLRYLDMNKFTGNALVEQPVLNVSDLEQTIVEQTGGKKEVNKSIIKEVRTKNQTKAPIKGHKQTVRKNPKKRLNNRLNNSTKSEASNIQNETSVKLEYEHKRKNGFKIMIFAIVLIIIIWIASINSSNSGSGEAPALDTKVKITWDEAVADTVSAIDTPITY